MKMQVCGVRVDEAFSALCAGVVSAAVSVVCELAKRNPGNYLSLAPILFKILTESQNNWMLIKIVKMLSALAPVEPRLAKKLVGLC
jgi:AP-3 complex subunit delta-1